MILFVLANRLTTAASTIFLQSTAPLYILVLAPWFLGEHLRRRDLAYMGSLAVGMGLLLVGETTPSATAPDPGFGNLLGGAAGLFWGLTIMGLRALGRSTGHGSPTPVAAAACGNLIAGVFALPFAWPLTTPGPADWGYVLFLGVIQIGVAYILLTRGVRGVPALEASLLLLAEPMLSPLWAWLAHGELPGPWASLGGAVILVATAVNTLWSRAPR
jgi:drug/metabolite transporter (DMT)-like permease